MRISKFRPISKVNTKFQSIESVDQISKLEIVVLLGTDYES